MAEIAQVQVVDYNALKAYHAKNKAALAALLGQIGDTEDANTIFGAKAYADAAIGRALELKKFDKN